jgi:hypothetical protein
LKCSVFNWRVHPWWRHPEILSLRRQAKLSRPHGDGSCPQWLIDEVKAEIACEKKVVPVVRIVEPKKFNEPSMTILLDRPGDQGVFPVVGKRKP